MQERKLSPQWVERKLNRIEEKLDRLLSALMKEPSRSSTPKVKPPEFGFKDVVRTDGETYTMHRVCRQCGVEAGDSVAEQNHKCLTAIQEEKA